MECGRVVKLTRFKPHLIRSNLQHDNPTMAANETETSSYLDYATFTSSSFSPAAYANSLVLQTNDPSDTPLDLSTPLSRVLFDVQEVDTRLDSLTTRNALPIISRTEQRSAASQRILEDIETQVEGLQEGYQRLEREVLERHAAAAQVHMAAERLVQTLKLGRKVQRAVQLGRQLEGQIEGVTRSGASAEGSRRGAGLVGAAQTALGLRELFAGREGEGLEKVRVVGTMRSEIITPAERTLVNKAQQSVREFSMSSLLASSLSSSTASPQQQPPQTQTYTQTEEMKSRATSALLTLYLLSPAKPSATVDSFEPTLLVGALQSYLQTAITSSVAALSRALATLPTLDRTLLEISARCQNIVALEALLNSIKPPQHPLLQPSTQSTSETHPTNFLSTLLRHLDTSSLPSYFWRSMAGQLSTRVQEIVSRGGVSARTLRSNRDRVRESIRECVDRGSKLPVSGLGGKKDGKVESWEREAAVMVGSVVGPLQR